MPINFNNVFEDYFISGFRNGIISNDNYVYADWTATGRFYKPIEVDILESIAPTYSNTHSDGNYFSNKTESEYKASKEYIKEEFNASKIIHNDYSIMFDGHGTTSVINRLQRIMNLKRGSENNTVVFVSHMEHHSNHISWYECAKVVVIEPNKDGLFDVDELERQVKKYNSKKLKLICSITACSNVTGIRTDYHKAAKVIHKYNGFMFLDAATSAPYDKIDMQPKDKSECIDALFFSPHKFLGGVGATGVCIFNKKLYALKDKSPDVSGGGTVLWSNAWGEYKYFKDIEEREDGGTPKILQVIKIAKAIKLKNDMGVDRIEHRIKYLTDFCFDKLKGHYNIHILADNIKERHGIISFYIEGVNYDTVVSELSERYNIIVRGGCMCAGTYGHYLLNVDRKTSKEMTDKLDKGMLYDEKNHPVKLGFVRFSLHPTMTNEEVNYICNCIKLISYGI